MSQHWKTLIGGISLAIACSRSVAAAPAFWSGLGVTFSKAAGADPTLPQNQDQITSRVAITRGDMAGLYNAVLESSYDRVARTAPADTEWATSINNPNQTIAASNWANLSFLNWADAYGGHVGTTIVNLDAVAHLITDNVYLDLRVTDWGGSETGGEFAYQRAAAPAASGDYNHDGIVDAADYALWRDTLGQWVPLGTAADGNLSGTIDAADYDVWKSHFGQSASGAASAAAAPEPTGAALALLGILLGLAFGIRQKLIASPAAIQLLPSVRKVAYINYIDSVLLSDVFLASEVLSDPRTRGGLAGVAAASATARLTGPVLRG